MNAIARPAFLCAFVAGFKETTYKGSILTFEGPANRVRSIYQDGSRNLPAARSVKLSL